MSNSNSANDPKTCAATTRRLDDDVVMTDQQSLREEGQISALQPTVADPSSRGFGQARNFAPETLSRDDRSSNRPSMTPGNPQPSTDPGTPQRSLVWAEHDLVSERQLHNKTKADLQKKEHELDQYRFNFQGVLEGKDQEIEKKSEELRKKRQELDNNRIQVQVEFEKKEQELDDLRKRWKQAVSELNRFMARGQGFVQVTDRELIQHATQLRFNVRNFAEHYFGGETVDAKGISSFSSFFQEYRRIPHEDYEACMKSSSKRPMVIRTFIWAFLVKDIFGQFCWAGSRVHDAMTNLARALEPYVNEIPDSSHDAKRKYQTWRANTATLLIDGMNLSREDDNGIDRRLNEHKVQDICNSLRPFSKSSPKELADQISHILNEALHIDKLISKQAAEVVWFAHELKGPRNLAQDPSELQRGERVVGDTHDVRWVLAPGMMKRGKSTGEDFDIENILLDIEEWYEPKTIDRLEESPRDLKGSTWSRAKGLLNTGLNARK